MIRKKLRKFRKEKSEALYLRRKNLTLKKVCKISNIKLPKELKPRSNYVIPNVTLSADYLNPGCIFYCIDKEMLNEYQIKNIIENCLCVITAEPIEGCNNIIIDDVREAAVKIFKYIKNLSEIKTITVTGSIGKTSTKEMIEAVLKQKYKDNMVVSIGNSNSVFKVAHNINKIKYTDKILLHEIGAGSMADDIVKNSAMMIEADVVVYTNIKDSHIEWYGSRENIAKEKFTLSDYGNKDGLALVNFDDEILRNHKFKQRTLSYSLNNSGADYYAEDIMLTSEGTKFNIVDNIEHQKIAIRLKVIGEHHILNALTAYAVGRYLGLGKNTIIRGLKKYKTSGDRQNLINVGKYKVLADCYNSSYDALKNILKTFSLIKVGKNGSGKKIAVIGDIFELGEISEETHRKVGKLLALADIDKVIFQGNETKFSYEEYSKIKDNSVYCVSREELFKTIRNVIEDGDLILFKASHGMHFSSVIDTLFGTDIGEKTALGHKEYTIKKDNQFIYTIFEDHATIKKYLGDDKKVNLPNVFENLPVEKLGKAVFKGNKAVEEVIISDNIVRLRNYCFKECFLKNINFSENLKQIGVGSFSSCSQLEKVVLPEGLLVIESKAFSDCENLREVYIPESVEKISTKAFWNSKNVAICCKKGSYAESYAQKQGIIYRYTS